MGEIADDIRNGLCCAICGSYFVRDHGFPVLCKGCWKGADEMAKEFHSEAKHLEANDVAD